MRRAARWVFIGCIVAGSSLGHAAHGDVDNTSAVNVQEGDNESRSSQSGEAASGDAVAGQVVGVVSAGDTSVDATNRSENVAVATGDADGANVANTTVGLSGGPATPRGASAADIVNDTASNVQEGDNDAEISQSADAVSGDAVGGQVIGVVTAPGGSADLVLANTSLDSDIRTGDAVFSNNAETVIFVVAPPAPGGRCPLPLAQDTC